MKAFYMAIALAATLASCTGGQSGSSDSQGNWAEPSVFKNGDVEFRQIDSLTWHGNGHLVYNESVYLIKGDSAALLLDAGTTIPGLRKIAEDIAKMPVMLAATHVHPDHTGSAINEWDSIWICEPDTVNAASYMAGYKGKIMFMSDGQVFDLGNRKIEVIFTPGHTPGSASFIDKEAGCGFSGDAFGSTNLLVTTSLSQQINSCSKMAQCMEQFHIGKLYPGHYGGDNPETLQRVKDIAEICQGILDGKYEPETSWIQRAIEIGGNLVDSTQVLVLPNVVEDRGVKINYGKRQLK